MNKKTAQQKNTFLITAIIYTLFIIISFLFNYPSGKIIGFNFFDFFKNMIFIMPPAFLLIGLFEVWISKEKIEEHMGVNSGIKGYLWAIVLAGPTVGGLYVAFPVAYALAKKGAKLSVIFFYLGSAAVCRIPMTLIEISFLGLRFTLLRLSIALPLIFISSILFGNVLEKKNYQIKPND